MGGFLKTKNIKIKWETQKVYRIKEAKRCRTM